MAGPSAARTSSVGEGSPLARFPDLRVEYYEVTGRTAAEIRASLDRRRPRVGGGGERYDAATEWSLYWHVPADADGSCRVERALVMRQVTVTLPRLGGIDELPPAVQTRWKAYMNRLERHEASHARRAYRGGRELVRALRATDCTDVHSVAQRVLDAVERRNADYDRRTRHGLRQGARFP